MHSRADGHLGCFHVLGIVSSAVMNSGVLVSVSILVSLVCMPCSGITGLYGSSIPLRTYTTFYLYIHLSMDTWVASSFWLL